MRQIEPNTFICADSIEVLREIKDKAFDLCLTDPPYGMNALDGSFTRNKYGINRRHNWDCGKIKDEHFLEIFRVSMRQIIWGYNYYASTLLDSKSFLVWDKVIAEGLNNYAMVELAYLSGGTPAKIFKCRCSQPDRVHPTQKPVPLFVWCILNYSKPGDLIIDPFCGSGTTALACHKTGRRFICIDREQKYIDIAQQRYKDLTAQQELFGADTMESGAQAYNSASLQCGLEI